MCSPSYSGWHHHVVVAMVIKRVILQQDFSERDQPQLVHSRLLSDISLYLERTTGGRPFSLFSRTREWFNLRICVWIKCQGVRRQRTRSRWGCNWCTTTLPVYTPGWYICVLINHKRLIRHAWSLAPFTYWISEEISISPIDLNADRYVYRVSFKGSDRNRHWDSQNASPCRPSGLRKIKRIATAGLSSFIQPSSSLTYPNPISLQLWPAPLLFLPYYFFSAFLSTTARANAV